MARVRFEQRSVLAALEAYLTTASWSGITYSDGFQPDQVITNPMIAVTFPPSEIRELQLGRTADRLFSRRILVNAYMESEPRAQTIVDDIMDFMDLVCVNITDENEVFKGTLICGSETIRGQVLQPVLSAPKSMRWRGVVSGQYEAFYPAP